MVILIVEKAPEGFKGDLSQWLIPVKSGVYIGNISNRIREKLWEKIKSYKKVINAIMIYSYNNEQGFDILVNGNTSFEPVDYDGYILFRKKNREK